MKTDTDWRSWGRYPEPIDFSNSLRRYVPAVLVCLLIALVAAVGIWFGTATLVTWSALLAALAAAAYLTAIGLQSRVVLRLDAAGVHNLAKPQAPVLIPWAELVEVSITSTFGNPIIRLRVREPQSHSGGRAPASINGPASINVPVSINAQGFSDAQGVAMLINDYRQSWADQHAPD
jgi:hypothetical protein